MDFNVTEYENVIDLISDSTLQQLFKKLALTQFWRGIIKKNIHNYPKRFLKYFLFPNNVSVGGHVFFIYLNQNNILQQTMQKQI